MNRPLPVYLKLSSTDEPQDVLFALLMRLADRDQQALSEFYDFTVGKVFALALKFTGSREDAEEIACDVYARVWDKANSYDTSRGSIMAWLMVMTRSRALDVLRYKRVRTDAETGHRELIPENTPQTAHGPADLLSMIDEKKHIYRALSELSDERRNILELAFFKDLSQKEIAVATGLPLGTVKSHMRRAMQTLRDQLAQ